MFFISPLLSSSFFLAFRQSWRKKESKNQKPRKTKPKPNKNKKTSKTTRQLRSLSMGRKQLEITALQEGSQDEEEVAQNLETFVRDELRVLLVMRNQPKFSGRPKEVLVGKIKEMLVQNPLTTEELNRFLAWRETRVREPTISRTEKERKEEEEKKKWSAPDSSRFIQPTESEPTSKGPKNIPLTTQSPADFLLLLFDDELIQQCVDEINIILGSERSIPFESTRNGTPRKRQRVEGRTNGYQHHRKEPFQITSEVFKDFLVVLVAMILNPRKRIRDYWGLSGRAVRAEAATQTRSSMVDFESIENYDDSMDRDGRYRFDDDTSEVDSFN